MVTFDDVVTACKNEGDWLDIIDLLEDESFSDEESSGESQNCMNAEQVSAQDVPGNVNDADYTELVKVWREHIDKITDVHSIGGRVMHQDGVMQFENVKAEEYEWFNSADVNVGLCRCQTGGMYGKSRVEILKRFTDDVENYAQYRISTELAKTWFSNSTGSVLFHGTKMLPVVAVRKGLIILNVNKYFGHDWDQAPDNIPVMIVSGKGPKFGVLSKDVHYDYLDKYQFFSTGSIAGKLKYLLERSEVLNVRWQISQGRFYYVMTHNVRCKVSSLTNSAVVQPACATRVDSTTVFTTRSRFR